MASNINSLNSREAARAEKRPVSATKRREKQARAHIREMRYRIQTGLKYSELQSHLSGIASKGYDHFKMIFF